LAPSTSNDPESENGSLPSSSGVTFTKVAVPAVVWLVDQLLPFFELARVFCAFQSHCQHYRKREHYPLPLKKLA
jgi:hypothetical protein